MNQIQKTIIKNLPDLEKHHKENVHMSKAHYHKNVPVSQDHHK